MDLSPATNFKSLDSLPIYQRRDDILAAIAANQVTIITAETGAGKSTQVPQYLAAAGYQKIIVTQPRILAARNLAERVRQEYSWREGRDCSDQVGYRTASERSDAPSNVILYCTDGLQLVRELTGSGIHDRQILVLDEVHEWNENMEVLVAWAKKRCQEDVNFKVVLMSATIDASGLANYFNAPAPIAVTGRTFAVEQRQGQDLVTEIITLLASRRSNMLVFLPGKAEIQAVALAVTSATGTAVPIIPLHSQLEPAEQQLAFASYPQGKVVLTTNIAQTSVTIDDIDVVIDSGLERRAEVRNNVEGLFIEQTSQADCQQRAGRAGRTKEGLYILAQLGNLPCLPLLERPLYGVPEIMRKHIDRVVLRLASIGIDIESLDFYHAPSHKTIKQAKRTLVSLGALTTSGLVTELGQRMERFPVESSYARMLVEAANLPPSYQTQLATIIAIQEVGGITKGGPRYNGWRRYTKQNQSDLLAEYEVFLALDTIDEADYETIGIIAKNAVKAAEVGQRLYHDLGLIEQLPQPLDEAATSALLRCIVAGQLHLLWLIEDDNQAVHLSTKQRREVSSSTVVKHSSLVTGTPFDLEVPTAKGLETLRLVNDLTAVEPAWLEALAPDQFKLRTGKPYFDGRYGTLAVRTSITYRGRSFEASGTPILEQTDANRRQFILAYSSWLQAQVEKQRQAVQLASSHRLPAVTLQQVLSRLQPLATGAVSLFDIDKRRRQEIAKLSELASYFDQSFLDKLRPARPAAKTSPHHNHRRRHSDPSNRTYNRHRRPN